jgi:signal transduction histidine kinase/ActR/RegA family two-component response regulator
MIRKSSLSIFILFLLFTGLYSQDDTSRYAVNPVSEEKGKRILVVYAKDSDLERLREFTAGFSSYLSNKKVNSYIKAFKLDFTGETPQEEKLDRLKNYLRGRLMAKIDIIITTDFEAHEMLVALDSLLPRHIPVISVFCSRPGYQSIPRYSTFVLDLPYKENLRLGMEMFPNTKRVYVLSDDSQYGTSEEMLARSSLKQYEKKVDIIYHRITENNFENIINEINSGRGNAFVILSSWRTDSGGNYIFGNNHVPFISRFENTPVFGIQNLLIGSGILGGYLFSVWDAGYQAAARSIKSIGNPLLRFRDTLSNPQLSMDYKVLQRFHINKAYLPKKANFINKPASMFDDFSTEINFIIALIVLLSSSLVVFALYHFRYIRISKSNLKLTKENEERKELLNNTLSVMSEGVISFDNNLKIIDINSAAMVLSGKRGNFLGKSFESVFNTSQPKGCDSIITLLEKVLKEKERLSISNPTRINYNDRESRVISGSISPVVDYQGVVNQLVFVFYDITESFNQKRFLNLAVESARSYTWYYNTFNNRFIFDDHYRIFAGNEAPSETSMNFFIRNIHPEDREKFVSCHQKMTERRTTVFVVEYRIRFDNRKDYEWWERRGVSYTETGKGENELLYIYGMDINIEEHKARESELIDARIKAEESDRLKSAFLSNISHEIRTPLNGIVGFANLLTDPDYTQQEKENFIKVINDNSKILMSLISDILDLSRIESNSMTFDYRPVNLNQQLSEILTNYKIYVRDDLKIVADLPDKPAIVYIDPFRNRQVITNLINNSLKFTESGEIRFGYHVKNGFVEVYVSDTGKGIRKDLLNSIFQRFYKVDEFITGTGLGLPICKAIVEHFGGNIWAESEVGKGTTMRYTIQCQPQSNISAGQESVSIEQSSPSLDLKKRAIKKSILIAEDLESNYMLMEVMLSKYWTLLWAKNGKEAVDMFESESPDMILMDIKMPIMDGLEATRQIREKSQSVPIVAQTANAFDADRTAALQAGCNDMLVKPIKTATLLKVVNKFLTDSDISLS